MYKIICKDRHTSKVIKGGKKTNKWWLDLVVVTDQKRELGTDGADKTSEYADSHDVTSWGKHNVSDFFRNYLRWWEPPNSPSTFFEFTCKKLISYKKKYKLVCIYEIYYHCKSYIITITINLMIYFAFSYILSLASELLFFIAIFLTIGV